MAHKVFISHHHANDQAYKEELARFGEANGVFIDQSVDTGDISERLSDQRIREKIRDQYLRDTSVTIVLVGTHTKRRKHIDWEIYSSMIDGEVNKKSGILVINLPSIDDGSVLAAHGEAEKEVVYPECRDWQSWSGRGELEVRFPYMPSRIVDSLANGAKISVTRWRVLDGNKLRFLVDAAYDNRHRCEYDLSAPMRRRNT